MLQFRPDVKKVLAAIPEDRPVGYDTIGRNSGIFGINLDEALAYLKEHNLVYYERHDELVVGDHDWYVKIKAGL